MVTIRVDESLKIYMMGVKEEKVVRETNGRGKKIVKVTSVEGGKGGRRRGV